MSIMSEIGGAMSEMYNLRQISRQKGLNLLQVQIRCIKILPH